MKIGDKRWVIRHSADDEPGMWWAVCQVLTVIEGYVPYTGRHTVHYIWEEDETTDPVPLEAEAEAEASAEDEDPFGITNTIREEQHGK